MILLLLISFTGALGLLGSKCPESKNKNWNIMKLTQSWPPAVCIYLEKEDLKCEVPRNITTWVIHGLWPTLTGTEGPNCCNNSWKFDASELQSLRPTLDLHWPSIILHEKPEDSWDHEWVKHGTCGTSLAILKDEFHYFNKTLSLHFQYNLLKFLENGGIRPSDESSYKADDIMEVLQQSLGVSPSITCVKDKKTENFYLEQVEICLDKSFQPVECSSDDVSSQQAHPLHDLLFEPEMSAERRSQKRYNRLHSNIHDCGPEGESVYFKPMPA